MQNAVGDDYIVEFAMRYQSPSIETGLKKLMDENVSSIHVIPLFPQYASATCCSVIDKVMEISQKWQIIPDIKFTSQFLEEPLFIETVLDKGRTYMAKQEYDHYLFSYHGLPDRQIRKDSVGDQCMLGTCCGSFHDHNRFCYRAQCFHTTRLIAAKLGLKEEQYTVCFQSRLGKDPWIKPYTEDMLKELAAKGVKKVLSFSPAFVSDCLETTIEVGETYQEDFIHAGGEQWDLVDSLNTDDKWVECLKEIIVR